MLSTSDGGTLGQFVPKFPLYRLQEGGTMPKYYTIDEAIEHFEKVLGAELTDEYKEYVKYRDSKI